MTTKEILLKYTFIIERVKRGDAPSLQQIRDYVLDRFNSIDIDTDFSERTFLRDKNEIVELYDIDINYNRSRKGYEVIYLNDKDQNSRTLDAFNLFLTLREASQQDTRSMVIPDYKCQLGTEYIFGLLHAIRHCNYVMFAYSKYDEQKDMTIRHLAPYALKESQGRWYVVGKDQADSTIKVFGLDRISALTIDQQTFKADQQFDPSSYFAHRFGVNAYCDNGKVEEVTLSFKSLEGKYLTSKPLHPTQSIVRQTEEELVVSVKVYPSHDFVMAILSYGYNVRVISPSWLAGEVKERLVKAAQQY